MKEEERNALHEAFRSRNKATLERALSGMDEDTKLKLLNDLDFANEGTMLHIAAMEGNLELAKILIENGADPTRENIHDETAYAAAKNASRGVAGDLLNLLVFESEYYKSFPKTVEYLKDQEVKQNAADSYFLKNKAFDEGAEEALKALPEITQHSIVWNALRLAAQEGDVKFFEQVKAKYGNPNFKDENGKSNDDILYEIVAEEFKNIFKNRNEVLLEEYDGIDQLKEFLNDIPAGSFKTRILAQALDDEDNTAIHIAAKEGNLELAEILVEHGADPRWENKDRYDAGVVALVNQRSTLGWIAGYRDTTEVAQYLEGVIDKLNKLERKKEKEKERKSESYVSSGAVAVTYSIKGASKVLDDKTQQESSPSSRASSLSFTDLSTQDDEMHQEKFVTHAVSQVPLDAREDLSYSPFSNASSPMSLSAMSPASRAKHLAREDFLKQADFFKDESLKVEFEKYYKEKSVEHVGKVAEVITETGNPIDGYKFDIKIPPSVDEPYVCTITIPTKNGNGNEKLHFNSNGELLEYEKVPGGESKLNKQWLEAKIAAANLVTQNPRLMESSGAAIQALGGTLANNKVGSSKSASPTPGGGREGVGRRV